MRKAVLLLHHPSLDLKVNREEKKYVLDVVITLNKSNHGKNSLALSSRLYKGYLPSQVAFSLCQGHHNIPFISSLPQATSDRNIAVPDEYQHRLGRPGAFYEQLEHLTQTVAYI